MTKNPFILVPLSLLSTLILEKFTLSLIYNLGIYCTAMRIKTNLSNAYKDYIYCVYRSPDELSDDLIEYLNDMDNFPCEGESCGFKNNEFNPTSSIYYLENYGTKNPEFNTLVLEWHQVRQAFDLLSLKKISVPCTIKEANDYERNHDIENCPFILINNKVMLNIYRAKEMMQPDERALWAMYLGIVSIIGNKTFAQTTSEMIKCRMFGARNKEELNRILGDKSIKKMYKKYTTKYQYNKLLNKIQDRGMVIELGLNRRTYLSTKLKTINDLADAIAAKELEVEKKEVRNRAKNEARIRYFTARNNGDMGICNIDEE